MAVKLKCEEEAPRPGPAPRALVVMSRALLTMADGAPHEVRRKAEELLTACERWEGESEGSTAPSE